MELFTVLAEDLVSYSPTKNRPSDKCQKIIPAHIFSPPTIFYHRCKPNFVITKIATITIPQNQTCLIILHLVYKEPPKCLSKTSNHSRVALVFLLLSSANLLLLLQYFLYYSFLLRGQ